MVVMVAVVRLLLLWMRRPSNQPLPLEGNGAYAIAAIGRGDCDGGAAAAAVEQAPQQAPQQAGASAGDFAALLDQLRPSTLIPSCASPLHSHSTLVMH